ncbi:GNAT family N-acetyltransferase [Streptomyces sp. AK02-01A]|uniref:GNAT family N-acetyltransferase n=1 Tax=Streptomyces sp. AK02-01A TaxID=3028648 RepID=UPI0029B175FD|nr:GNAT family N-acetyltransferase [Streptomyces sp. AK02-01A]MDX3851516.1 GNAT family N-acetyltransferase [Streptomyces sp. AK02-01A]
MIRAATPDDLDAIAALHTEARATYYRGHLPEAEYDGPAERARTRHAWSVALARAEPEAAVLRAEHDGVVAGVAAYRPVDGVMTLTQLHVSPAHWRQGIGTALHTACVTAWQHAGVRTARLQVFEHNTRAQAFYIRHGWYPDPGNPRHGTHLELRLAVPAPDG